MHNQVTRFILFAVLLLVTLLTLIPALWMVVTSLKTNAEVFTFPIKWLPERFRFENYPKALSARPFGLYLFNSFFASGTSAFLTVVLSLMAGYGFAHFKFPGQTALFLGILSTIMIPFETIAVPLYIQIYRFNWLNTYQGLILPTAFAPLGVFIMRQFILGVPKDLVESARIDGAGELRILFQVVAPLSMPALSATAIFTFVATWNSYLWPLLVVNSDALRTLPLGMALFENQLTTTYNQVMAVAVYGTVPMVAMFVLLQRNFVRGVVLTGLREG